MRGGAPTGARARKSATPGQGFSALARGAPAARPLSQLRPRALPTRGSLRLAKPAHPSPEGRGGFLGACEGSMRSPASVLDQKLAISNGCGIVDAEPLDGSEDVVGRLGPTKGL